MRPYPQYRRCSRAEIFFCAIKRSKPSRENAPGESASAGKRPSYMIGGMGDRPQKITFAEMRARLPRDEKVFV